ncbi:ABC transporter substrate-binding protein [Rhizobium sp. SSA_523]|uniref:ABC transporter substrate-binding protein n=1 Tax=Rhizobium sp. SSA_523 TaxID=2952477 RepID=UPI0020901FB1|nr:ABC transporter substrate-binding protein [Rhizobium sp. SSA_523]MCO5732355.1 ABC transporter substrate-binding protein [Rhizobium sp. SSA_523]WKC21247.1 ABC transporter substrate-binding protein [Rhizobium sp. SSA_523]
MISRRQALALLAGTLVPGKLLAAYRDSGFVSETGNGTPLPPVAERLPRNPRLVNLSASGRSTGRYGGSLRILIGGQRDIRYMPVISYARLVGYNERLELEADLVAGFEIEEERIFTFRLREGHRWSDGSPFTAEDFRFVWEDMFLDAELYRGGMPASLKVNGHEPRFEVLDPLTIRYSWDEPNPDFLTDIASASPLRLMMPSAYLRQFHSKYQTKERLKELVEKEHVKDWVALFQRMSRTVRPENPDLPTLDAWCNRTAPPSGRFVFERNPYYHRVDEAGQQLPYVDRVLLDVSSSDLIAAKTGTGESDLQFTNLDFSDYTFLKSAEQRYPLKVDLWKRIQGSRVCLFPNLNCKDDVWRALWRDVRVRRALSLAINRREINKAVFFGLASESANTVLPASPLFNEAYRTAWASFDPEAANRLLDEAGLSERNIHGTRLLADGRPAHITVESAGENSVEGDVLELVRDYWAEIGIRIFVRVSQRELLRRRLKGGDTIMTVGQGIDNGIATADMSPKELAPTTDGQQQWPLWGLHSLSGGSDGRAPDLPEAQHLLDLLTQWQNAQDVAEREQIWQRMLHTFTDQVFTIGTVNATLQPIVHARSLRNVPAEGLYGYDPLSYLGVYMPDTFWYDRDA